ncbi:MAG: large-conductance mechanosensitive channel protein MscL [Polyangia bacterium]
MSFLKEFRDFAMRGNVVDLAVGVIIGGAFGKIVASLVADIVMPTVGLLVGGVDFTKLAYTVNKGMDGKGATIKYGMFIQSVFDFVIVALAIFVAIQALNRFKKKEEAVAVATPPSEILLTEIRDLLQQQNRATP